jgi:hypothetical protein
MRKFTLPALTALLFCAAPVTADIAIPPERPKPERSAELAIEVDAKAERPKLVIPLRALVQRGQEEPPVAQADPAANTRTWVAGLSMAVAVTLGGVWFVRRNGPGGVAKLAVVLAVGGSLAVGTWVYANAAPPPPPKPEAGSLFDGPVDVEIANDGDKIRLVLDAETLKKLSQK